MLNKTVRIINQILNYFGIQLIRIPQKTYDTADIWSNWICHSPVKFGEIYRKNREIQKLVSTWLTNEVYENSLWNYGIIKNQSMDSLNSIEKNITYTDLLVFFSMFLNKITYLEIGVSAGKNFFQVSKHLENSSIWGLDIEEINPILEQFYSNKKTIWESDNFFDFKSKHGLKVKKKFTLNEYLEDKNQNKIYYLSGDKFENKLWERLKGEKFNLIFSDAFHTPNSIKTEMDFLIKYDLINKNNFIMIWDDINPNNPDMVTSLLSIGEKLNKIFSNNQTFFSLFKIHGTFSGDINGFHNMGIFISDSNIFSFKN